MSDSANHLLQVVGNIQCRDCSYIGEEWTFRNKYTSEQAGDFLVIHPHTHCPICDSKNIDFNFDKKPKK